MGFAAGFGEGFTNAFDQSMALKAKREDDAFSIAYNNYAKQKDQYENDKKQDEKAQSVAKDIVTGIPGLDSGSWTYAYKMLREGYSPAQVEDKLTSVNFMPIPTAPSVPTPINSSGSPDDRLKKMVAADYNAPIVFNDTSSTQQDTNAVNTDNTTNPTQVVSQTKPVQKKRGLGGMAGYTSDGGFRGSLAPQQQTMADNANKRLADTLGTTPQDIASVSGGYVPPDIKDTVQMQAKPSSPLAEYGLDKEITPGKLSAAIATATTQMKSGNSADVEKATKFIQMLPDIQAAMATANPADGTTDAEYTKSVQAALQPTQEYRIKTLGPARASVKTMSDSAKSLGALLDKNGSLLTWGAKGLTAGNTALTQATSIVNIVDGILKANDPSVVGNEESFMNTVTSQIDAALGPNWKNTAEDERALDSALIRFGYSYGKAIGVSGQNMSDKDYARVMNGIMNTPDPGEFKSNLNNMIHEAVDGVNNASNELASSPDLIVALKDTKLGVGDALRLSLAPMDENALKVDTTAKSDINPLQQGPSTDAATQAQQQATPTITGTPTGPTKKHYVTPSNPDAVRALQDAGYPDAKLGMPILVEGY